MQGKAIKDRAEGKARELKGAATGNKAEEMHGKAQGMKGSAEHQAAKANRKANPG